MVDEIVGAESCDLCRALPYIVEPFRHRLSGRERTGLEIIAPAIGTDKPLAGPSLEAKRAEVSLADACHERRFLGRRDESAAHRQAGDNGRLEVIEHRVHRGFPRPTSAPPAARNRFPSGWHAKRADCDDAIVTTPTGAAGKHLAHHDPFEP